MENLSVRRPVVGSIAWLDLSYLGGAASPVPKPKYEVGVRLANDHVELIQ